MQWRQTYRQRHEAEGNVGTIFRICRSPYQIAGEYDWSIFEPELPIMNRDYGT